MLARMIDALAEMLPGDPALHAPGPRQRRSDLPHGDPHGFTSVMMDGSLKADAKTPADYDYNVDDHRAASRAMAHWVGASVEGELGVLGSLESGAGRGRGRPRRRRRARRTTSS